MKKGITKNPEITKQLLYKEWVENRLSQKQIANKYNVGLWIIEKRIKDFQLTKIRSKIKYILNNEHININSPVFWYLVGLTISDGYIDEKNKRISIQLTNDIKILETLSDYYSTNVKIPVYSYQTNVPHKVRHTLTLSNEKLINLFHTIGIYGYRKTYDVSMPDPNSPYLFNFLLRGFIDGDGNIRTYIGSMGMEFRFYIESHNLVNTLIFLCKKYLNIDLYKGVVKGRNGFNITSNNIYDNTIINVYSDIPILALERKRNIVKKIVDDIVHRYEMINHNNW